MGDPILVAHSLVPVVDRAILEEEMQPYGDKSGRVISVKADRVSGPFGRIPLTIPSGGAGRRVEPVAARSAPDGDGPAPP